MFVNVILSISQHLGEMQFLILNKNFFAYKQASTL